MGFLGKLLGTDEALTKTVDTVSKGLDKLILTEQEKAEGAAAERSEARKMIVEWMKATAGQNIARRVISLAITAVWLGQYILSQVFALVAVYAGRANEANQAAEILRIGATDMNDAVMLILAFYFAAPHLGDMAKAIIERKAKS